jgi:hypothetical protein
MKITVTSTTKRVEINGLPTRVWEGHTESGTPVHCFIACIAVPVDHDAAEFERDLLECDQPSAELQDIPERLSLSVRRGPIQL